MQNLIFLIGWNAGILQCVHRCGFSLSALPGHR